MNTYPPIDYRLGLDTTKYDYGQQLYFSRGWQLDNIYFFTGVDGVSYDRQTTRIEYIQLCV